MSDNHDGLRSAIELACQPTGAAKILDGRRAVLAMDRAFVLANIEDMSRQCLDLDDYWQYRRLLELCAELDQELTRRIAQWGLGHANPDVREAAEDYAEH